MTERKPRMTPDYIEVEPAYRDAEATLTVRVRKGRRTNRCRRGLHELVGENVYVNRDAARCPDCGGVPCPTCGTGCIEPTEAQLRVAAFRDRWSFKQGTLRERLEWARVQHQLQAELDAQGNRMPQKSDAESAAWHRACVEWYAEMVRDLDVMLSGVSTAPEADRLGHLR